MKVKFWGVRGSIPSPGPAKVKYGGNTTCIEVVTDTEDLIILDGGSGIRELGLQLAKNLPVSCSIFLSHTHWDHIQGLPFFTPFFIPGNTVDIYGTFDPVYQKDLETILTGQMEYCYFPVRSNELKAQINYTDLREGQAIEVGSAVVTPILMNHPVLTYGYRIDSGGKRIFFTGDHEPPLNIYEPGEEGFQEYEALIETKNKALQKLLDQTDIVIADAQYTNDEYESKVGWGHGTFQKCTDLAANIGAKVLYFTHHDPTRTDSELDQILNSLKNDSSSQITSEMHIAREGLEFSI
jgi:phosphoribosyl 1,2-cyclic phosphodiesterase